MSFSQNHRDENWVKNFLQQDKGKVPEKNPSKFADIDEDEETYIEKAIAIFSLLSGVEKGIPDPNSDHLPITEWQEREKLPSAS